MEYVPPINGNLADPNRPYINKIPGVVDGSIPSGAAFEHPMREIVNAITAAGITPDEGDLTQLEQAIIALSAGAGANATETVLGKVELATAAEALGGSDTTRVVTSAGLASSKSYGANGYQKFPGGMTIQWGTTGSIAPTVTGTITVPVTFATLFASVGVIRSASGSTQRADSSLVLSTSQFSVNNGSPDTAATFKWLAIGY